jgi:hypothetical protein|tara:strand:+ start:1307 stop:2617 length:1311 start_codon:yes stop_codon:yes gene_type:complete
MQMSEQETAEQQQTLATSVNELETLAQQALELNGEAREELVEQIKSKCEEEGLSATETDDLLEEIGLVQEARKVQEDSKNQPAPNKGGKDGEGPKGEKAADVSPPAEVKGSGTAMGNPVKGKAKNSDKGEPMAKVKEEIAELPKTKSGMMAAVYEKLGKLKKDQIATNFESILSSLSIQEGSEEVEDSKPLDVQDDINALTEGEDLSDAFKSKASTIFEAAVQAKVNQVVLGKEQELEEQMQERLTEELDSYMQEIVEKVDNYLNYVSEEWVKDNQLAIEKGIRSELTEGFLVGLKNLFTEHYITIPEEKVDVVDDLFDKVEGLEKELNEQVSKNIETQTELTKIKKEKVLSSLTKNLTETQKEKVAELAENVDADNAEDYEQKVEVLKENYFPSEDKKVALVEDIETQNDEEEIDKTPIQEGMEHYMSAISRHVR